MATRRVAIFVDMLSAYGRDVLMGISRYSRNHGPWVVYGDPERIAAPIEKVEAWNGDGVIAQAYYLRLRECLQHLRLPVVNVSQNLPDETFPSVLPDNIAVGRMAAEHLLERGFHNFAFCGFTGHQYSELRHAAFAATVAEAGATCAIMNTEPPNDLPNMWTTRQAELAQWVKRLPKPVGMFCCNDARSRHVAEACMNSGVRVPEDLALIGVDNDELVCEMSNPPLSSIDVSAEQLGYEAAVLLDRLMAGAAAPDDTRLLKPTGVVVRRSTDVLAIDDQVVVAAMRYIHDHAATGICVEDVVARAHVSRRVLERRFRALLDRTIGQVIAQTKIDRVKRLLVDSDLPMPEIAERSGYPFVQQLNAVFKSHTGMTPTAWRRQFRAR